MYRSKKKPADGIMTNHRRVQPKQSTDDNADTVGRTVNARSVTPRHGGQRGNRCMTIQRFITRRALARLLNLDFRHHVVQAQNPIAHLLEGTGSKDLFPIDLVDKLKASNQTKEEK